MKKLTHSLPAKMIALLLLIFFAVGCLCTGAGIAYMESCGYYGSESFLDSRQAAGITENYVAQVFEYLELCYGQQENAEYLREYLEKRLIQGKINYCFYLADESGNILLKTVEGAAKLLLGEMKKAFLSSTKSKLGALLVKDSLGDVKKLLDPSEVGGTPFLGISKPVLKAHGSSDARAIRNAVFRAVEYAQSGIIADVEAHIDVMKVEKNG